jgi:hypothetical protein
MYAGLLSFMAFVVWGVTGIEAVFLPAPGDWQPPSISAQKEFPFEGGGNLDDKKLAKAVFQAAALTMVGGYYNVHRDDAGNLAFLAYSANGQRELTYLEKRRVRVVFRDSGLELLVDHARGPFARRPRHLTSVGLLQRIVKALLCAVGHLLRWQRVWTALGADSERAYDCRNSATLGGDENHV